MDKQTKDSLDMAAQKMKATAEKIKDVDMQKAIKEKIKNLDKPVSK